MNKKFLLLACISLCMGSFCFGQRKGKTQIMHAIGTSYMYGIIQKDNYAAIGASYSPRLIVGRMSRNASISISSCMSVAYRYTEDKSDEENKNSPIIFELPVSVEMNFGHVANKNSRARLGGHIGLGWGINSMRTTYYNPRKGVREFSDITSGLYFKTGVRFQSGKNGSYGITPYTILGRNNTQILGVRLMKTFL